MELFRNTLSWRSKPPTTTTIHPKNTKQSPLDIPEILERIFFFSDDFTLTRTIVLVCRQWLYMNQGRCPRTVYYSGNTRMERPKQLCSQLVGASRLYCVLSIDDLSRDIRDPFRENIKSIIRSSQEEYKKQLQIRNSKTAHTGKIELYAFSPLKELVIDIACYIDKSLDIFPFPPTLTRVMLCINTTEHYSTDYGWILHQCPLLETLSIEAKLRDGRCLKWDEPKNQYTQLTLRSLTLNHIFMQQHILENLLESTPKLKVLKLIAMMAPTHDSVKLLNHIRSLPLVLNTFHLSLYDTPLPQVVQQQALEMCPFTSEWNLWATDMSPTLFKELEAHTSCLTTLELHWERKGGPAENEIPYTSIITAPRLLFQYLCDSPNAIHLRTLKTAVHHEDMDIFGRGRCLPPFIEPLPSPGIWRCRDLRVLHINLRDPYTRMTGRVHNSVVFGYISRVAPYLEELEIFYPYHGRKFIVQESTYPRLQMDLKGGFCLLGRLKHLQRLRISCSDGGLLGNCKDFDLNWMVPSGRTDKYQRLRRQVIEEWKNQQSQRAKVGQPQELDKTNVSGGTDGSASLDSEVLGKLENLGLFEDVEETVNEIDTGLLVPFPSLVGISFHHPTLVWPEKKLSKLFPSKRKFGFW